MDRKLLDDVTFKAPKGSVREPKAGPTQEIPGKTPANPAIRLVCAIIASIVILWAVSEVVLMSFSFMGGHKYGSWTEFIDEFNQYQNR